ncbi:MAG: type II toxin-antitoxin system PemK/MazF family toxin [Clostridia bacterium]|nr:type II toxin-antitoxin system PemK/MazF family toxin [Clostridia bacterium]
MQKIEQGNIMKVDGIKYPVMVVSNDFFNRSGKAIICPILKDAAEGPLHIRLKCDAVEGYVLCEQVRYIDLSERHFARIAAEGYYEVMDISDAVMGMFDHQGG